MRETTGRLIHSAGGYDLLVWLLLLGRERAFRDRLVRLARLERGESVLDIGCGTGSLAIAAKRRVGPSGSVDGVDASPEMIARARRKARRAGTEVSFSHGDVTELPFPSDQFNVVLSTMMLHHLPAGAREQCMRELRRVLRPGGRALVVDFGEARGLHRRDRVALHDLVRLPREAGLTINESGPVGVLGLNFVLATA